MRSLLHPSSAPCNHISPAPPDDTCLAWRTQAENNVNTQTNSRDVTEWRKEFILNSREETNAKTSGDYASITCEYGYREVNRKYICLKCTDGSDGARFEFAGAHGSDYFDNN